ncbi:hypothetical protein EVAR_72314_1 [Eumeta japonica]|uniref:Ig-like domain-containing protein n=1 Tax=Eumeta variegata TaxID=151549 RepID=A0A4C1T174_EUMVA|nr:hypothetical protein EVAR_72314_1 [Eumeta japonica]
MAQSDGGVNPVVRFGIASSLHFKHSNQRFEVGKHQVSIVSNCLPVFSQNNQRNDKVEEITPKRFTTTSSLKLKPTADDDYTEYTCQAKHKALAPDMPMRSTVQLWLQQDDATWHTARDAMDLLKNTFRDRLISHFGRVWPQDLLI